MSKIDTMVNQLRRRAVQVGGAHLTIEARQSTIQLFGHWAKENNRQIVEPHNRHLRDYIAARKRQGVRVSTLQNEASHLRAVAKLSFTNSELGINGRQRKGTKRAPPDPEYYERLAKISDPGVRAAARLQRRLGLRAEEAVCSGRSLRDWERALLRGFPVRIIHGTKGGRLRLSEAPDRELALDAIAEAIKIARQQRGQTVCGKQRTLKSAKARYKSAMAAAGFVGIFSPHSLRYAYTCDLLNKYQDEGLATAEALSAAALCLGHGDGRGRFVRNVYLQGSGNVLG